MVHAGGAPRTVSPPPEECIKLGEAIVKWATEKTKKNESRIHLKQWWCLVKGMSKNEWDTLCHTEFFPYYEKAQLAIAIRYIDGTVNAAIAQRFLRLYFPELEKNENDKAVFESNLRTKQEDSEDDLIKRLVEVIRSFGKVPGDEEAKQSPLENKSSILN